jgi:hypothetical protein
VILSPLSSICPSVSPPPCIAFTLRLLAHPLLPLWWPCCCCLCAVEWICRLALSLPTLGRIAAWAHPDSRCCCALLTNPGALPKPAEQGPHGHGKGEHLNGGLVRGERRDSLCNTTPTTNSSSSIHKTTVVAFVDRRHWHWHALRCSIPASLAGPQAPGAWSRDWMNGTQPRESSCCCC